MDETFFNAISGQWVAVRHIVTISIQSTGTGDQERHVVQATLVNGDEHALESFQGPESRQQARAFLTSFFDRIGAQRLTSDTLS